jgi:hypothetical protein
VYIPVSIVAASMYLLIDKQPRTRHRVIGVFLLSFLVISLGIASLIGFVGHVFFADSVATNIGWATGSQFQLEVGFANLAIGILGITCIWLRGNYWVATVIAATIFLWGGQPSGTLWIALSTAIMPLVTLAELFTMTFLCRLSHRLAAYVRTARTVKEGT